MKTMDTRISDTELVPLMAQCWEEAGWKPIDIQQVACVIGPGGFMSLRVAVATANALSWGLDVPACGIHLADVYEARMKDVRHKMEDEGFWIHSTKKEEFFVKGGEWKESTHVTMRQLEDGLPESFSCIGELLPEHEAWLLQKGGKKGGVLSLEDILSAFLAGQEYTRQTLMPWYGREG